ncbi:MAG: ATP-binding protein [Pseudomonadota bacterium]
MANESSIASETEKERLQQFYLQSNSKLTTTIFPAVAIWAYFYFGFGQSRALVWAVLVHGWQVFRYVLHYRRQKTLNTAQAWADYSENRATVLVGVFAFIWGLVPWMMLEGQNYAQLSVVLLMLMGMMAGSLSALSLSMRCGHLFLGIIGSMLMVWLLMQWHVTDTILAVSITVFTLTMMGYFRRQYRSLITLITARFEKDALAQTLAEQKDKLLLLHQERSRFFAAANHDLRQPLQALTLYSQLLERELAQGQRLSAVQKVASATRAIGESLDAMLDLHQLETLTQTQVHAVVSANDLLIDAHAMWSEVAARKGLQLRFRHQSLHLHVAKYAVSRIVSNLIDNAIKYTDAGGVLVTLRQRTSTNAATVARLEVWDTGIGISADHHGRIFQEFFQVHNPQRDRSKGVGIGLNAVQRMCEQLEYPFGLRSRLAKGSVFFVDLPIATPQQVSTHTPMPLPDTAAGLPPGPDCEEGPAPPPDAGLGRKVLILDDDPTIAEVLQLLVGAQVQILAAANWHEAQALTASHTDIRQVLLDYRLGEARNGLEIAQQLISDGVFARQQVTLMTGDASAGIVAAAQALGIRLLSKPITPQVLMEIVLS